MVGFDDGIPLESSKVVKKPWKKLKLILLLVHEEDPGLNGILDLTKTSKEHFHTQERLGWLSTRLRVMLDCLCNQSLCSHPAFV